MQLLLWLLLPVAAASGWLAARRSGRSKRSQARPVTLRTDYFQGLNYLLNEQPDKAIEVFIRLAEVDSETVETHLALGSLFRRRGEVDRAIRIHQNLIARPSLGRAYREQALLELARDYKQAGLLDRAEALLTELIEVRAHTETALRHLLDIYQREKEWAKAVAIAERLAGVAGRSMAGKIAQFHCELADSAVAGGDYHAAHEHVDRALAADRNCVRASLLQGQMHHRLGEYDKAVRAFLRVEEQDPGLLSEVLNPLLACYREMGRLDELARQLTVFAERHAGVAPMLMLSDLIRSQQGPAEAERFLVRELERRPTVRGLQRLLSLKRSLGTTLSPEELPVLQSMVSLLVNRQTGYRCERCGFGGRTLYWQCPGCREWNTVRPIADALEESGGQGT